MDRICSTFEPAMESLGFARDAFADYRAVTADFYDKVPRQLHYRFNDARQLHEIVLRVEQSPPRTIKRFAREALLSAKYALDQATYALRQVHPAPAETEKTYFPWARSPDNLQKRLTKLGIDARFWDIFTAEEPYWKSPTHQGGNDILRDLAELANAKHSIGIEVAPELHRGRLGNLHFDAVEGLRYHCAQLDPVSGEAVLVEWRNGTHSYDGTSRFEFVVMFRTPSGALRGTTDGLAALLEMVDRVVRNLNARCMEFRG